MTSLLHKYLSCPPTALRWPTSWMLPWTSIHSSTYHTNSANPKTWWRCYPSFPNCTVLTWLLLSHKFSTSLIHLSLQSRHSKDYTNKVKCSLTKPSNPSKVYAFVLTHHLAKRFQTFLDNWAVKGLTQN